MLNFNISNNTTDTPVDTLWSKFKNICHLCLDKIPSKTANTNTQMTVDKLSYQTPHTTQAKGI